MGVKLTNSILHCHLGSAQVAGATADTNIAIAGIKTTDELLFVWELATSTNDPTDQTAASSITSDGNIQCTNATDGDVLLIVWVSKE